MKDLKELISAGVQFGHQTWRWCPKMKPYIWGAKNSVHLIDVYKTAHQLEKAAQFLEAIAAQGKPILWVGTKKAAQDVIKEIAEKAKSPYVNHRWVGGTLTNYPQVKKSVTKLLHYEDILARAGQHHYTKKELGLVQKMLDRLSKNVGGIRKLTWPVGALVVVDVNREHVAVSEARAAQVPVVALVDTNSDPSMIDYVIPANDDAPRSIAILLDYLAEAVQRGHKVSSEQKQAHQADKEALAMESGEQKSLSRILDLDEEEDKSTGAARGTPPARTGARRSSSMPRGKAPQRSAVGKKA